MNIHLETMGRTVQTNLCLKTKRWDPKFTRKTIFGDVQRGGWSKALPTSIKCEVLETYDNGDTLIFCDKQVQANHGYGPTLPKRTFILTRKGKLAVAWKDLLVGEIHECDKNYVVQELQSEEKRKELFMFPSVGRHIDAQIEIK